VLYLIVHITVSAYDLNMVDYSCHCITVEASEIQLLTLEIESALYIHFMLTENGVCSCSVIDFVT
jgi:hypothetical protein